MCGALEASRRSGRASLAGAVNIALVAVNVSTWCLAIYFADLVFVLVWLLPWRSRPRVPGKALALERHRSVRAVAARRALHMRKRLLQAGLPQTGVPNQSALRRRLAGEIAARIALGARWAVPTLALLVFLELMPATHSSWRTRAVIFALLAVTAVLAAIDLRAYARSVPHEQTAVAAMKALDALTSPDVGEVRGESRASKISGAVDRFCAVLTLHVECDPRQTDVVHRERLRERAQQVVRRVLTLKEQSLWGDPECHQQLVAIIASVLAHVAQPTGDPRTTLNLVDPELVAPGRDWSSTREARFPETWASRRGLSLGPHLNQRWRAELIEAVVLLVVAAVAYLVAYTAAHSVFDDIANARFSPSDTAQVITAISGAIAAGTAGVAGIIRACATLIRARAEMVRARASVPSAETSDGNEEPVSASQSEATAT